MRLLVKLILALVVVGVATATAFPYVQAYWTARNKPDYRLTTATRGEIVRWSIRRARSSRSSASRSARSCRARSSICRRTSTTRSRRDSCWRSRPATLQIGGGQGDGRAATREAEVVRVQALLRQAENEEKRANELRENTPISSPTPSWTRSWPTGIAPGPARRGQGLREQARATWRSRQRTSTTPISSRPSTAW